MNRVFVAGIASALGLANAAHAAEILVTDDITTSVVWTADNTCNLQTQIYVLPGASSTIEAGTVIASTPTANGSGSLAVCRGAKIFGNGTMENPVVMTSTADDRTDWREAANEWGNLTIMGNAYISNSFEAGNSSGFGNNVSPMEGLTPEFPVDSRVYYGGTDDDDNSGGLAYFAQERFAEASSLIQSLIDREPENAELWLIQANAYLGMDRVDRAAENFEVCRGLGGATSESLAMLGNIYVHKGLADVAVDRYIESFRMDGGGNPAAAFKAGRLLARQQELEAVERLASFMRADLMEELDLEEKKALLKLEARVAVQRGQGAAEARILEEIVQLDPMDGEALRLLGQYHGRQDDGFEKAVSYFDRAGEIEGFEADSKVDHAQLLVRNKDSAGAIRLLKSAQSIRPRESVQRYLDEIESFERGR